MSDYKNNLESQLWAIADILRGNMDANEYKNYILGFIFYKYLSEKIENYFEKELRNDNLTFTEAYELPKYQEPLKNAALEELEYFLEPKYLFSNIVVKAENKDFILDDLGRALNHIGQSAEGTESADDFENLFEDVDLLSSKLGKSENDKNNVISKILLHLANIDFHLEDEEKDILGDAYEYLISQFASDAGKKAVEFYTPQEVSKILAKMVTLG